MRLQFLYHCVSLTLEIAYQQASERMTASTPEVGIS